MKARAIAKDLMQTFITRRLKGAQDRYRRGWQSGNVQAAAFFVNCSLGGLTPRAEASIFGRPTTSPTTRSYDIFRTAELT
ncbi:hypothetical protein BH23GEM6_BH23GEM6_06380 [soil metagenome]